jgi:hypothetical protein
MVPGKSMILIVLILLGVIFPAAVNAQANGMIRGTVYADTNKDGFCGNADEPPLPGVPVEFTFQQDGTAWTFVSGPDGSYGLTAAQFGTWTVTVKPATGFYVSSGNPVMVTINESQTEVEGVDFCVATVASTGPITLPGSGSIIGPPIYAAIGAFLVLIGLGVEIRRRRSNRA